MTPLELRYRIADLRLTLALRRFAWSLDELLRKYRPDQPRAPGGMPEGGQWVGANNSRQDNRIRTALSAVLIMQRVGLGDDSLVRHCIYEDALGRQFGKEINATELCPPTLPALPYNGPL